MSKEISKIKLLNNIEYDIKDDELRNTLEILLGFDTQTKDENNAD